MGKTCIYITFVYFPFVCFVPLLSLVVDRHMGCRLWLAPERDTRR